MAGKPPRFKGQPRVPGSPVLAIAAAAIGFELLMVLHPGSYPTFAAVDDLLLGVSGAIAALACWRRSRREADRARCSGVSDVTRSRTCACGQQVVFWKAWTVTQGSWESSPPCCVG